MANSNRRAAAVPREGDTRQCPFCRGVMFFQGPEWSDAQPGWFCTCGYRILAGQPAKPSIAQRPRALSERRANAFRKSMKGRARAERLLKNSQRLPRRRRAKT